MARNKGTFFVKVRQLEQKQGLSIGYRNYWHKEHPDKIIKQSWFARVYLTRRDKLNEPRETYYRSLKLPYQNNSASEGKAIEKALAVYPAIVSRAIKGLNPRTKFKFLEIAEEFFAEAKQSAERNEEDIAEGIPPSIVLIGAKNPITEIRYGKIVSLFEKYIRPFIIDAKLENKDITKITEKEIKAFIPWCQKQKWFYNKKRFTPSPSTFNRASTVLRFIFEYARDKNIVRFVPSFTGARLKVDLEERSRKKLTEDVYTKLIIQARENYESSLFNTGTINSDYHRDLAEQHYIFIKLLSWVGFRPSSGETEKTVPRWEDIEIMNQGTPEETMYLWRSEKKQKLGQRVRYIIQRPCIPDIMRLKELYKERGIENTPYLFAHTHDGPSNKQKGDHINGFRRQWERLLYEIGEPNERYAPQSERLSFYSLRGYYMTCRIRYGELTVEDVAKMCNTSSEMVRHVYRDWDIEREAPRLTKGIPDDYMPRLDYA